MEQTRKQEMKPLTDIMLSICYFVAGTGGFSCEKSAIFYKNHQYVKFLTISACYFLDDLLK